MSAHNFWDNFSHGFMHGMFNSNPFFGCFGGGLWGNPFMQNSCFMPFQFNFFQPNNLFMYPSMNFSVFPMMQDFAMPTFNFSSIMPQNNIWDNYSNQNSLDWDFGDTFIKNTKKEEVSTPTNTTTTETDVVATQNITEQPEVKTVAKTQSASKAQTAKRNFSKKATVSSPPSFSGGTPKMTDRFTGTAAQLDKVLGRRNGVLKGKGYKFLQMQEKYGVNAAILAAICCNESRYGTSNLAVNYNNVAGISGKGAPNGFRRFDSVDACIEEQARLLKENYVDKGLVTIHQVHMKYCPPKGDKRDSKNLNAGWGRIVTSITNKIYA